MIGETDVAGVVDRIVALYNPDRIYAFGSWAKGTHTEKSDLDLVIVKRDSMPRRMRGKDVLAVLARVGFEFDLLFVTPDELAEFLADPYSLLSQVMHDARTLYERQA